MQGVSINGDWCRTKAQLKATFKANPEFVYLVATSIFGNKYDGVLTDAPAGDYLVVGPDPARSRKWYAQITVSLNPFTVKVK